MIIQTISDKIASLFSNENITNILFEDMLNAPLDTWFYINEKSIRYKFIEINEKQIISLTEWLNDDHFNLHTHADCDETIFIIKGYLTSTLDSLERTNYQKLYYKAGTVHKVYGTKGTLISVKFDRC